MLWCHQATKEAMMDTTPTIEDVRDLARAIFTQAIRDLAHDDAALSDPRSVERWHEAREDTLCWIDSRNEGFVFWCVALGIDPDEMRDALLAGPQRRI